MSGRTAEWEQRDRVWAADLPPREKLVLLAFLDCDRDASGGALYPSIARVADQTGHARSTVQLALDALTTSGILEPIGFKTSRYGLRGRVVMYLFHPERLPRRPDAATPPPATDGSDPARSSGPVTADPARFSGSVTVDSARLSGSVTPRPSPIRTATQPDLAVDRARQSGTERTYERSTERKNPGAVAPGGRPPDQTQHQPGPHQPGPPGPPRIVARRTEATQLTLWDDVLERVQGQVSRWNFHTWFGNTRFASADARTLSVYVPNALHAAWLPKHYGGLIQQALIDVGQPQLRVQFVEAA